MVLIVAIPLIAATFFVIERLADAQLKAQEQTLISSTRAIAAAVDAELKKYAVPSLQETLSKYIKSVEPFLTPFELNGTKKLSAELAREGGEGQKLQSLLVKRAREKENWVS